MNQRQLPPPSTDKPRSLTSGPGVSLCVLLICSGALSGCSGISPVVLDAHKQAGSAVKLYRANARANLAALLADLQGAMADYAADLAAARLRSEAREGVLKATAAQAILDQYASRLTATAAKIAAMRAKIEANEANYELWDELHRSVRRILQALEQRRKAEDALRQQALEAAKRAAKRAARGGI